MVVKSRRQSLVSLGLLVALLGLLILPAIVQADNNPPEGLLLHRPPGGHLVQRFAPHRRERGGTQAIEPAGDPPQGLALGWRAPVDPRQAPDGRTSDGRTSEDRIPEGRRVLVPGQAQRHLEHRRESYRCVSQATLGSEPRLEEPAAVALSGPAGMDPCCAAGHPGDGGGFANRRGDDLGGSRCGGDSNRACADCRASRYAVRQRLRLLRRNHGRLPAVPRPSPAILTRSPRA